MYEQAHVQLYTKPLNSHNHQSCVQSWFPPNKGNFDEIWGLFSTLDFRNDFWTLAFLPERIIKDVFFYHPIFSIFHHSVCMSTHSPWPFVYCSGVSEYTKSSSCPMMSRSGSILISHSQPKSDSFSAIPFSNLCGRVCRLTTPLPWYWVVYMMASGD